MFGRLQFRRIRWQEEQVDALGDAHLRAGVPARAIEHEEDPLGWSSAAIPGEGGEHLPEEGSGDGGEQPPLGLTGGGTDEAADVEPLVALLDRSTWPLADWCPDAADQGQQPNPVFVGGPELDRGSRMRRPDLGYLLTELC